MGTAVQHHLGTTWRQRLQGPERIARGGYRVERQRRRAVGTGSACHTRSTIVAAAPASDECPPSGATTCNTVAGWFGAAVVVVTAASAASAAHSIFGANFPLRAK